LGAWLTEQRAIPHEAHPADEEMPGDASPGGASRRGSSDDS
jgi:endogenous inhibitor of DNA gyrase (YacG/DUF329 family)